MYIFQRVVHFCGKISKIYFTNEALDYFCSKVCKTESNKSKSLLYKSSNVFSIFLFSIVSKVFVCMFQYKSLCIYTYVCYIFVYNQK